MFHMKAFLARLLNPLLKQGVLFTNQQDKVAQEPIFSEFQILELAERLSLMPQTVQEMHQLSIAFKKGEQPSPYRGSGFEYEESRLYQAGDEIRHINWRLMGRTGQAYSKQFQEERQESWMILLDMRQSMRFGTQHQLKVTQGIQVAGYYAWLAQQLGYPISAVALAEQLDISPIFEGKNSYIEVMHHLSRPCPPIYTAQHRLELDLASALQNLHPYFQPGIRLILISDFQDLTESTRWLLSGLQAHLFLKMIHIVDAAELHLPTATGIKLQALNGKTSILSEIQTSYRHWAQQFFSQQHKMYQQLSLPVKWLKTDDELTALTDSNPIPDWLKELITKENL